MSIFGGLHDESYTVPMVHVWCSDSVMHLCADVDDEFEEDYDSQPHKTMYSGKGEVVPMHLPGLHLGSANNVPNDVPDLFSSDASISACAKSS